MNQQNAESKLEQAAVNNNPPDELHGKAVSLVFKIVEQWGNAVGPTVSEFADEILNLSKEYWQSLTTPASNEVEGIVKEAAVDFMWENERPNITSGYQAFRRLFDEWFANSKYHQYKINESSPSKPHTVEEGQTQEPEKCNGNCGMNYCDEYGCIDNKPEGDVSHLLTQLPAPIKTEGEDEIKQEFKELRTYIEDLYNGAGIVSLAESIFDAGYDYRSSLLPDVIAEFGENSAPNKEQFLSSLPQSSTEESQSGEGDAVDWWISLKDRLPKHGQKVDLWLGSYRKEWTWEEQDSENIMISGAKATHWMPAPTPPKSPIK